MGVQLLEDLAGDVEEGKRAYIGMFDCMSRFLRFRAWCAHVAGGDVSERIRALRSIKISVPTAASLRPGSE